MAIEKVIRDYLNECLPAPVYCERPEKAPKKYVLVTKTGSSRKNKLNTSHIAITSSAQSMYDAIVLNSQVENAMDVDDILDISCEFESDYNHTDPNTKTYKYQCVYNIYHY